MKFAKMLTFLAGLILATAVTCAARATSPTKTTPTKKSATSSQLTVHHMMGTISSVSDSDLVLSHKWKGKSEETKFALDSQTKKEGTLAKGSEATVAYHFQNHQRMATDVKVSQMKSTMKSKTSSKKS
jgi:hypothetical protein